jgi:hypothetical protein
MFVDCLDKVVSKVCSGNCQRYYTLCNSEAQKQVEITG